ncbi:hypothetical protein [Brazilian marseillevirus]|uniref:hypothetical protein n=1 Tax=Brazilian marseillevirus TaxID=1813599 RepID=UPI0007860675|nr:hypothetical protein A3303_gp078 [Brazilian marseillevirus]AMQ10586.1 hypothetical protein [Brazilian marseillevirus]
MKLSHIYVCLGVMSQSYISPDLERMQKRGMSWWRGLAATMVVGFAWPFVMPMYIRKRELGEV